MKTCTFEGCGRPHYARTLCHPHYWRMRRGMPLVPIAGRRHPNETLKRDDQGRKFCIKCELWISESNFVDDPGTSDGLGSYCKPCRSAQARAWKYGLTPDQVASMIHDQSSSCKTCDSPLSDGYCVDHDHACCPGNRSCGECVRGLLCQECNMLIGKLELDPERLKKMLSYIGDK